MKRTISYILVGLTLSTIFLFSACGGNKKKSSRTDTPTSGTITFVSDESFSPIIEEERQQFEFEYPKAHLKSIYTDEITGFKMLEGMKTCLLITSRGLSDGQIAYFKSKNIIPQVFPIGYDGLALIVNRANNDTCITVNNVKKILLGQATKWSDINPGSKRGDIEVVFDNRPNAIGIIGSNWLNDKRDSTNTTFKKNIHVMSVSIAKKATPMNSWKPYQAYLLDGRYPFVRTLYCNVVDPSKALPWSFANYITNPRGQLIIFKSGLLPYRGDITIKTVDVKR